MFGFLSFFVVRHNEICLNCNTWAIMTRPWGAGFWDRSNSPITPMLFLYSAGKQDLVVCQRNRAPLSQLKFVLHWSLCDRNPRAGVTNFFLYHQTADMEKKRKKKEKKRVKAVLKRECSVYILEAYGWNLPNAGKRRFKPVWCVRVDFVCWAPALISSLSLTVLLSH